MLHAFNYTFPATSVIADAARKRLVEHFTNSIEIDAEFLDLARNTDAIHESRVATFIREKYGRHPPDLVMTLGSVALPFLIKHHDLFPNTPVVFTSISPQTYAAMQPTPAVTGVVTGFDLAKTLSLAEQLQPDAQRLVIVAGSGETDRRWQPVARKVVEEHQRKFDTTYLFGLPYSDLAAKLSNLSRDTIVMVLTVFADSEGKTFVPAQVAADLAALSAAPVYGPYDTYIGKGIVGGFVETFESVGSAAADLAVEILGGKSPASLPPRKTPGQHYRVDYQAMQRWGLKEGNLPPGAVVLFKQPTIWDEHRGIVFAGLFVVGLQGVLLSALLVQRRRRRRFENLLAASEERMTFAATATNTALWQLDRSTNKLWATEHCRTLFGIRKDLPLTQETLLATVHPDDLESASHSVQRLMEVEAASSTDVRIVLPDNEVRWIRMRGRRYSEDNGRSEQIGGIFVDVTDQKLAEAEAALQREEIAHLMRVSVLGELSGSIAHEINQPLTAILSNAQAALHLLRQKTPDLQEIRDALQEIVQEDNRAGEVIHRLRHLLRKGERKFDSVNINELVKSTVSMLHNELIGRKISIRLDLENSVVPTMGDSVQLQQVLLNLVMNGMDAMASTASDQRHILISTRGMESGSVEVRIRDRGHGVPAQENGRLFEPFYTTKEHGLGLGLAICATIIQSHGGRLTVVNHASGGAIAMFSLPGREWTAS
jgi:signal transduction histidine kinase/ABC-type uncharacterized transport system substrate-binding protein